MDFVQLIKARSSELVFLALALGFGLVILLIQPVIMPIIISLTLYAVLEPLSDTLYRLGMRRSFTALLSLLVLLLIGSVVVFLLVPELIKQLTLVQAQLGQLEGLIDSVFANINQQFRTWGLSFDLASSKDLFQSARPELDLATLIASSNVMFTLMASSILVPLFTFFLIRDFKTLRQITLGMLPNRYFELAWLIYYRVAYQLQRYVRGIILQSFLVGLISGIGFYLVGFETPFLLGAIAGMLNIIPYIGMLLAMTPPLLVSLSSNPFDPQFVLAAVLVIVVTQVIDNIFIVPTVIAHSVSLHPLTVIAGIIIFGNTFGILGMVLAIPILAASKIIYFGLKQGLNHRPI